MMRKIEIKEAQRIKYMVYRRRRNALHICTAERGSQLDTALCGAALGGDHVELVGEFEELFCPGLCLLCLRAYLLEERLRLVGITTETLPDKF